MQNPWVTIWTEPRMTIQKVIAENPNKCLWWLASIYGFSSLLNSFQSMALGDQVGLVGLVGLAIILSWIWGYVVFSVWSWVVYGIGKIFRGKGTFQQVRAAYAWSCVPLLFNCALWIFLIALFGPALFSNISQNQMLTDGQSTLLFLVLIAKVILAIWALVIYLNALSEVQQYSILRTIGNVLVAGLLVGFVLGLVWNFSIQMVGSAIETSNTAFQIIKSCGGSL